MTASLLDVLRASLRSTLLYLAATIIPMVVVLTLLELSHRQEVAQESAEIMTGSLPNSPPARSLELQPASAQWPPQAPSGALLAPPPATGTTETPTRSTVAYQAPVPLPRSRPNRR
jgi:hypothetical protein